MRLPRKPTNLTIVLALLPILLFAMCKGRPYDLADIMVDPVPKADIYPEVSPNIPCLNITQSEATDFMEKEMASISLVPLETRDDCLIGSISDLYLKGDTIVVVDGQKAKQIMLFNKQGKFLRKIGSVGSGPGEYTTITKARISPIGIEIHDVQSSRFIQYDYEGNVLKEITFHRTIPEHLLYIDSDRFLASYASYYENRPFALQWLENDSVVASAFPFTIKRGEAPASIFRLDRDRIGFHIPYSDTVFSVQGEKIIPEYTFGLMNTLNIQEYLKTSAMMTKTELREYLWTSQHSPPSFFQFYSTVNLLIITHQIQYSVYLSVVDRNTLQIRNYLRGRMKPLSLYLPPDLRSASGNTLVGFIDENYPLYLPDESREFIEKYFSTEDRQLLQTYDYGNNNPIVWLMELK